VRGNELFGDFPEIDLAGSSDTMSLSGDRKMFLESVREEFLEESRARFVGLEEHYIGREDDRIIIDLRLSRAFGEAVGVSIYLFGYKKGCPFAEMPKIHIRFGAVWHRVYDQSRIVEDSGVTIDRQSKHVTVRVPLGILQSPERLMTGTRIYLGEMSLDAAPWRMVKLRA